MDAAGTAGIRREFLLYWLTLLELWCRIAVGGERPQRLSGID